MVCNPAQRSLRQTGKLDDNALYLAPRRMHAVEEYVKPCP